MPPCYTLAEWPSRGIQPHYENITDCAYPERLILSNTVPGAWCFFSDGTVPTQLSASYTSTLPGVTNRPWFTLTSTSNWLTEIHFGDCCLFTMLFWYHLSLFVSIFTLTAYASIFVIPCFCPPLNQCCNSFVTALFHAAKRETAANWLLQSRQTDTWMICECTSLCSVLVKESQTMYSWREITNVSQPLSWKRTQWYAW